MVLIRIHYGPVENKGIIRHKVQKIMGLAGTYVFLKNIVYTFVLFTFHF